MRRILFTLPLFVVACAEVDTSEPTERLVISPVETQAVLALLNDADTDVALLDDGVGLQARAAQNIIAVRNGADGIYPSADDHRFDTLEEVEAVKYVGAATMASLLEYVLENPAPSGTLVEGVEFTAVEHAAVLWGVNSATVDELDHEVGLSSTAAKNIVAGAPFDTLEDLAAVAYVGKSALLALRGYSPAWSEMTQLAGTFDGVEFDGHEAAGALELANHATFEDFVAGGMYSSGARAIIEHRPYESLGDVAGTSGVGPSTMAALKAM